MAFEIWEGPPRSGKSYTLVNRLLRGWLLHSKRHIYHNLPLVEDQFLADLARTSAIREEFRARLHFLDGKQETEAFDPDGKSLGVHNPVREFWYFCPAGAVIVLDEVAEEWTALDRSNRSELLQPVFNRQGRSKRLILLGVVGVALWFGFWAGLRGLARLADSQKTGNWLFAMSGQVGQTNGTTKAEAVSGGAAIPDTAASVSGPGGEVPAVERERLVLVAPSFVRTTKGVYEVGSLVGSNRVRRILLDGFEWEGGGRDKFASLFH